MEEIKVINGKFTMPDQFKLSKETGKRRLKIRTPWMTQVQVADKDFWNVTSQQWFRHEGKDKPYIPVGHLELDDVLFKVVEIKQ